MLLLKMDRSQLQPLLAESSSVVWIKSTRLTSSHKTTQTAKAELAFFHFQRQEELCDTSSSIVFFLNLCSDLALEEIIDDTTS